MLKTLLATALALLTTAAFAATDINKATQAEIESIKGIGVEMSNRILDERKQREFRDWADLIARVKGIGGASAAKFSSAGLTVNGAAFAAAPVASTASAARVEAATLNAPAPAPAPAPASATAPASKALPGASK